MATLRQLLIHRDICIFFALIYLLAFQIEVGLIRFMFIVMLVLEVTISFSLVTFYLFFAVEPSPGVDPEGLEVAKECLLDVFKINHPIDSQSSDSLVEIFRLKDSTENKSNSTHKQSSTNVPSTSTTMNKVHTNHAAASQYLVYSYVSCFLLSFYCFAISVKWS